MEGKVSKAGKPLKNCIPKLLRREKSLSRAGEYFQKKSARRYYRKNLGTHAILLEKNYENGLSRFHNFDCGTTALSGHYPQLFDSPFLPEHQRKFIFSMEKIVFSFHFHCVYYIKLITIIVIIVLVTISICFRIYHKV